MKKFLDNYDTIIFDMDGVITSERVYWECAALTVYEFLNSKDYFGNKSMDVKELENKASEICAEIFAEDKLIELLKGKGVNSNWDLGYITVLMHFITGSDRVSDIMAYADGLSSDIVAEYDRLAEETAKRRNMSFEYFKRNGELWQNMMLCFQEWFRGDKSFSKDFGKEPVLKGKSGFISKEEPLVCKDTLKSLLEELSKTKRLCVGTGRPSDEILPPLTAWGMLDFFDASGFVHYDYVQKAESENNAILTKPHPYTFLKALFGTDYSDSKIICGDYDKEKVNRALVVGDAGADILAAKAMGANFCAVLTGIAGEKSRNYFEDMNAEYILNSVCDMID